MSSDGSLSLSARIKARARELDFDLCGIARARKLTERAQVLKAWCESGMHDRMGYMERNIEKRADPDSLFPGARSLIVTGLSYASENRQKDTRAPVLSRYTYGMNYHDVITSKLEKLLLFVKEEIPEAEGRIYVDSGQLFEKGWAQEAGLGWQGRHSIIINEEKGSFFFIGIVILNIVLDYDAPFSRDLCGDCRLCIDLCPTGAVNENRTIDARRCISNLTIENRGPVPENFIPMLGGRVYGCDRCQEVCPWNKGLLPNSHPEFNIDERISGMTREEWLSLSRDQFKELFSRTAMERISYEDLMRNIDAAIRSMDP
jgi:epoxyqueuosine reductase